MILGSGRSTREGNGNPIKYFYLENPRDRGDRQTLVHEVAKSGLDLVSKQQHELDNGEKGDVMSEKAGLKLNSQKTKITASHHFMTNRWGNEGNSDRFYFPGFQNHCR